MNEIAVLGDLGSVIGFRGLGFTVVAVEPDTDVMAALNDLIEQNRFAVIYMTEPVAEQCESILRERQDAYLPALIPIPSTSEKSGFGMHNVEEAVRKAVGFDVLNIMEENATLSEETENEDHNFGETEIY